MITCLCPGDDRALDLDAALEVPWCELGEAPLCLADGPHWHPCFRPAGHSGRHADSEDLGDRVMIVTAVWDD